MSKGELELKQLNGVWYGMSAKFKNSSGWGPPRGENLQEPPDGNKDKESGLIRSIDGEFDENVLAERDGRHAAAAKASGFRQAWVGGYRAGSSELQYPLGGRGGHTLAELLNF